MNQLLKWEETLFRDLSAFESDYIPDRFLFRDEQIKELSYNLRPALRGCSPVNTICRGLPGTGKTSCIRKLFSEAESCTKRIATVYVNCQIDRTPFSIFSKVYQKVSGVKAAPAGVSYNNLVATAAKIIADKNKVVLLCLDDVNYIQNRDAMNTTLFTVLRLHQEFEGVRMGVFAVVSDVHTDISASLNAGVSSSFRPAEVYFPPYSAAEMHDIYQARILQGVYPNVISKEILSLIVDYSMKIGDLRVGLDLIKRSVLSAENDARTSVTEEDVSRAFSVSKDVHVNETLKTLKNGERQLFFLIGEMTKESEEKGDAAGVTSGQVQRRAKSDLNISYTYFFEYMKKLEELRLVDLVKKDGVHGRMSYVEVRG